MVKKYASKSLNASNKNCDVYLKLQTTSQELSEMTLKRKGNYYWLLSDKLNGKKTPLIPPILVKKKFISNFKEKLNYFKAFFASQYTPISNVTPCKNLCY